MSLSFLDQEPPPGYIPGIGRGATGFTTSADAAADTPYAIEYGEDDDGGLLGTLDKEDEEADRIYAEIEKRLTRKKIEDTPVEEKTITGRFTDLKRNLSQISEFEWENLPEAGDLTRRNKRINQLEKLQQRFYAVPDSVLSGTNFQSISDAREKLLGNQLDNLLPQQEEIEDSYIADLEQTLNVADISKGRIILASLRKTEPNKANSWIASARLEEQAKNFNAAKKIISQGCQTIPRNEYVWLENIRLNEKSADGIKLAKVLVTDALKFNNKSQKLWLRAVHLENTADFMSRKRILMRGLEYLPSNVELWKELVNLEEDPEDVKKLLTKAVELCPSEWEFWLTLINLADYADSKSILNRARKALSGDQRVWIAACKLEEREGNASKIGKLTEKAVKESNRTQLEWLDEAASSEGEGFLKTCEAIVIASLSNSEEQNIHVWFSNADKYNRTHPNTAKYIYNFVVEKNPNSTESWVKLFTALKKSSDLGALFEYYCKAVKLNPSQELFSLMYAKDKWLLGGDIPKARQILKLAVSSENVWLARIKLESKIGDFNQAIQISTELVKSMPTTSARIWYKHIHLQRFLKIDPLESCNTALENFPEAYKLHLQKAQILLEKSPELARGAALIGIKRCPTNLTQLWALVAKIDQENKVIKARSTLDSAILQNPNSAELWLAKIKLEESAKNLIDARQLTNKALQKFPSSADIWTCYLYLIPKMYQRKNAFLDALKGTSNSAVILLNIGVFFWIDGKATKARSWFERALSSDSNNGDSWAWMYAYFEKHELGEVEKFVESFEIKFEDINRGVAWNEVNKAVENFDKKAIDILRITSKRLMESRLK